MLALARSGGPVGREQGMPGTGRRDHHHLPPRGAHEGDRE